MDGVHIPLRQYWTYGEISRGHCSNHGYTDSGERFHQEPHHVMGKAENRLSGTENMGFGAFDDQAVRIVQGANVCSILAQWHDI